MAIKRNIRTTSGDYHETEFHRLRNWRNSLNRSWPLYPLTVEESRRRSAYSFSESSCPYLLLISMREGKLLFQVEEEKYLMTPGKLLLIPPRTRYDFHSRGGNFYHKCVLEFKGINLLSILATLGISHATCLESPEATALFEEKFRLLADRIEETGPEIPPLLMGESYALLCGFALLSGKPKHTYSKLNAIRERLESNLDTSIPLHELAKEFKLHPTVMSRSFKKQFNYTPGEYRIYCRMEQAKYLLRQTALTLKEIAYQVGYCNEFYFSQEFQRATGRRPGSWRTSGEV